MSYRQRYKWQFLLVWMWGKGTLNSAGESEASVAILEIILEAPPKAGNRTTV